VDTLRERALQLPPACERKHLPRDSSQMSLDAREPNELLGDRRQGTAHGHGGVSKESNVQPMQSTAAGRTFARKTGRATSYTSTSSQGELQRRSSRPGEVIMLAGAPGTEGLQEDLLRNLEAEVRQNEKELEQVRDAAQRPICLSITEARRLLDTPNMGENIRAELMEEVEQLEASAALNQDSEVIQMAHEPIEQGREEYEARARSRDEPIN
jgi:hypothetical protein